MKRKAKIYYIGLDDFWRKEKKLEWLRENPISKIAFENITPDEKHNWINQTDNDFETLLPLIDKEVKGSENDKAIFKFYSFGVATNRDEWVYDLNGQCLKERVLFLINEYNSLLKANNNDFLPKIKWSDSLKANFKNKKLILFDESKICKSLYRPFNHRFFYAEKLLNDRLTINHKWLFGDNYKKHNHCIGFIGTDTIIPFSVLAFNHINDLNGLSNAAGGTKTLPLYRYDSENQKHENITDWALNQFQTHYASKSEPPAVAGGLTRQTQKIIEKKNDSALQTSATDSMRRLQPPATAGGSDKPRIARITKEDIFYYVYAVLHAPVYRKKYEQNLKREFPRLPFYDDFTQWREWGAELMDLHINYESAEPFALGRKDLDLTPKLKNIQNNFFADLDEIEKETFIAKPKTKLRADKLNGTIEIDSHTTLTGVPALAWEYKLGNRSAIEWILDQYKERKPKDATIAERFDNYRFEDYKETVIDLLMRVTNVSIKTMEIINQMPKE